MRGAYPPPTSSLGRSIASGLPAFAPPVAPQSQFIHGVPDWMQTLRPASADVDDRAAVVDRKPRLRGMRFLYSRGASTSRWFRSVATGQVESTKYQHITVSTFFDAFNDTLYEAGYPRNLGLSVKVASIPPEALGTSPSQMAPRPRYTRNIYTNRNYAVAPGLPAQPTRGVHS